jgi:hypothetical protein
VCQPTNGRGLAFEALDEAGLFFEMRVQPLDGDRDVGGGVAPKATLPNPPDATTSKIR